MVAKNSDKIKKKITKESKQAIEEPPYFWLFLLFCFVVCLSSIFNYFQKQIRKEEKKKKKKNQNKTTNQKKKQEISKKFRHNNKQ